MSKIQVISTFAKDTVIDLNHNIEEVTDGGPAFWISSALKKVGANFNIKTAKKKARVKIRIVGDYEEGRIISCPKINSASIVYDKPTLISTISNEFDLKNICKTTSLIAVDIQGYIRAPKALEAKFKISPDIYSRISILKATQDELRYLDNEFIESQKKRILIVTKGASGFDVYSKGRLIRIKAKRISVSNSIGAGDCLFSYFFYKYIQTKDPEVSANFAKKEVEKFLLERKIKRNNPVKNKILILTDVHGNEPIGSILVKDELMKIPEVREKIDWVVGNPPAVLKNKRFLKHDLNRISPGDIDSVDYEMRRAAYLNSLVSNYEYVIDIHQTRANSRVLAILPKPTKGSVDLALLSNIKDVLIWPLPKDSVSGPIIKNCFKAIGFEVGTKSGYRAAIQKALPIILDLILTLNQNSPKVNKCLNNKSFFHVYSKISPDDVIGVKLRDFKRVVTDKEEFVALLFGKHQKILGYKLKPVDYNWVKEYVSNQSS
jgi:succinylglutamate desuccinylase